MRRDKVALIEASVRLLPSAISPPFWFALIANLATARGWYGKALGALGDPTPYPQSDNPANQIIEPPAYNKVAAKDIILTPEEMIANVKQARADISSLLTSLEEPSANGELARYVALSKTYLEAARLNLGEMLGILGGH